MKEEIQRTANGIPIIDSGLPLSSRRNVCESYVRKDALSQEEQRSLLDKGAEERKLGDCVCIAYARYIS